MRLSIVVPTYNRKEAVIRLLKELEPLMGEHEILLADDSDDGTAEAVMAGYGKLVSIDHRDARRGVVSAVNDGIRRARNEVVLLMSDDHHLVGDPEEFARRLLIHFRDHDIVGIDTLDRMSRPFQNRWLGWLAWHLAGQIFPGASDEFKAVFAFDKSRIELLFDPQYSAGNALNCESDFQLRARRAGHPLFCAKDILTTHDELRVQSQPKEVVRATMLANHRYFLRKNFRLSWSVKFMFYRLYVATAWNWAYRGATV